MQKILLIFTVIFLILFFSKNIFAEKITYSVDIKNNGFGTNDISQIYMRDKISIKFSKFNELNYAHIFLSKEKENSFTFSLKLTNHKKRFFLFVGNFTVNLGCGLLMGNSFLINDDPFKTASTLETDKTFKAIKNGYSELSLFGVANSYLISTSNIKIILSDFVSNRMRYIDEESYFEKKITSLNSSINRIEKNYNHYEPINIWDGGIALNFLYKKYFFAQLFTTGKKIYSSQKELSWDVSYLKNKNILKDFLLGAFARISLGKISFFFEGGSSLYFLQNKTNPIYDFAFLTGVKYSGKLLSINLYGFNIGNKFNLTQSALASLPSNNIDFNIKFFPLKNLNIGWEIFYKIKKFPSSGEMESAPQKKINLSINIQKQKIFNLKTELKKYFFWQDGQNEEKNQFKITLSLFNEKLFSPGCGAILQSDLHKNFSWLAKINLTFSPFTNLKTMFSYGRVTSTEANKIYASFSPAKNSIIAGKFYSLASNFILLKCSLKTKNFSFYVGYSNQFTINQILDQSLSFQAKIFL